MAQGTFDDLARHVGTTRTRRAALAAMLGAALGQLTTHSAAARGNNRLKAHPARADGSCDSGDDCGPCGGCVYGSCRQMFPDC
jgi:hypothetical protein